MQTETRWNLTVRRNDDVWERPLRIIGPNLTGVDMRAQIRNAADTPGPPVADLALVTNGNAEGVRLASATQQEDGTWLNDVRLRLNKSTRQAFKYEGELGETATLEWGFLIAGVTRIQGKVFVPAQVYGSDAAPLNRPPSYGTRTAAGPAFTSGATLTISQDGGTSLEIAGVDLIAPFARDAKADAAKSETAAASSAESAAFAEEFSGPAYDSIAAGEANTRPGGFFRVPIAGTNPREYTRYQRTTTGSVEAASLAATSALAAPDGAKHFSVSQDDPESVPINGLEDARQVFSAKRFGVIGIGGDDTQAFRAFARALKRSGARHAVIPRGRYKVGRVDFDGVEVMLDCRGAEFEALPDLDHGFHFAGGRAHVQGGLWDLSKATKSSSAGIFFDQCEYAWAENVSLRNGWYGIFYDRCQTVGAERCNSDGAKRWPVYVNGGSNIWLNKNRMVNGQYDGLKVGSDDDGNVLNYNIVITENICLNNLRDGIDCATSGGSVAHIKNNICIINKLHGVDFKVVYGTQVGGFDALDIAGNIVFGRPDVHPDSSYGINVQNTIAGSVLSRARVRDNIFILPNPSPSFDHVAIRMFGVAASGVEGNKSYGYSAIARISSKCSDIVVERNLCRQAVRGVMIDDPGSDGVPTRTKVRGNDIEKTQGTTGNRVQVLQGIDTEIYDKEFICDNVAYTIRDDGTGTRIGRNYRGWSAGAPTGRGYIGDTWRESQHGPGRPSYWVVLTSASALSESTTLAGIEQRGRRTATNSPVGAIVPYFIGEEFYQVGGSGPKWWKATGLTNANWS